MPLPESTIAPQSILTASFHVMVKRHSRQFMGGKKRRTAAMMATVPSSSPA
jgi:hypothetical protein